MTIIDPYKNSNPPVAEPSPILFGSQAKETLFSASAEARRLAKLKPRGKSAIKGEAHFIRGHRAAGGRRH